ncbi:hypothetical protein KUTeg_022545 [Tegillarca granosa]|uniref:HTH OST-type domain-containing protein n=1 Tax=Tegillarca granosa TaxID=220873 RepID=A0ABQ9E6I1_TEGGR|nr:hypothetical protein KUTeg_022545 [Tegillarca granosa]
MPSKDGLIYGGNSKSVYVDFSRVLYYALKFISSKMTDKACLKNDTKKTIRALLLSAPAGLTVQELSRDYHDFMSGRIPFRPLGYTNLEDFLRDMPDVVQIFYKNGVMCIKAVADETTKHIERLVSKQKVTNKNKWATLRKGGPQPPRRNKNKPTRPPPGIPAFIRKRIIELFKSYPEHGLPLTHFEPAFSQRFGMQLSFSRLGFDSLQSLLSSVPDVVRVKNFGGEYRVVPVNPQLYNNNYNNNSLEHEAKEEYWEPSQVKQHEQPQSVPGQSSQEKTTTAPRGRGRKRSGYTDQKSPPGQQQQISCHFSDPDSVLGNSPDQFDKPILEEHPAGIWASQLPMIFQERYKKELSVKDQGYWSVIEFCSSLPNIIRIERPTLKGDWLLFDARIPKVESSKNTEGSSKKKSESTSTVDETKQLELKETLRQNLTGQNIPIEEMGFRSLAKYLISLDDSVLNIKYIGAGCIMVFACSNGEVRKTDLLKQLPKVQEEVHKVNRLVPADVVGPGTHYTAIDLPKLYEYSESSQRMITGTGVLLLDLKLDIWSRYILWIMAWTIEARNRMLYVCKNKALIAMPVSEKDRVISLCLTDTSDRDIDVHLNDLLVNEGYAVMMPDNASTELGYLHQSEVPDYGYIYGPDFFPVQSATEILPISADVEQSIEQQPKTGKHYIKEIQLSDRVIHIFNIDGTGYMVSREVSAFFWDADVVTSMLDYKKVSSNVRKLIISKTDYPELFEEYNQYHENELNLLTFYELTSVPYIIELFTPEADDICVAILEVIQNFDNTYWKDGDEDTDSASQSEDYTNLDIEELKLTLQALQFKRKRILQTMLISPTEGIVNELNSVEEQISHIKESVEDMQAKRALGPDSESAVTKTDKAESYTNVSTQKEEKIKQKPPSVVTPIKLNVVAPMQNTASPQKVQSAKSSSVASDNVPTVVPSVDSLINNMAQQQLMYQSMLMSQSMPGLNQPLLGNPALTPQMTQQFLNSQTMAAAAAAGLNPQLMMQTPMMNPFLQPSLTPQYVPPRQTVSAQIAPGMGRGGNRQDNMPLLPCLLPLLQNLNMDPFSDQINNSSSNKQNPRESGDKR